MGLFQLQPCLKSRSLEWFIVGTSAGIESLSLDQLVTAQRWGAWVPKTSPQHGC